MRVLLDTNVLCRLANTGHHAHSAARTAVSLLHDNRHELCLVPQVVYEYWGVATWPTADNGFGMASTDVNQAIDHWCDLFVLLRDERGIFSIWRDLVVSNNVSGKNDHDARLVAAMKRHDIRHLLTFNIADFQRYSEIERLDPREVAANRI